MAPSRFTDIIVRNLKFSAPTSSMKGQNLFIQYNDEKIILQLPKMKIPFGISKYNGQGYTSYSLDMSLQNQEPFKQFMLDVNDHVKTTALLNSASWFKETCTPEQIDSYFYSSVRDDPKGKFASLFKLNLPIYDDKTKVAFFDDTKQEIKFTDVQRGSYVVCLVELLGVWFSNKKFGLKWNVNQIKVFPDTKLPETGFMMDDSDDDGAKPVSKGVCMLSDD